MPAPTNIDTELEQPLPGVDAAWASGWTPTSARAGCDAHKLGSFTWSWQLAIDAPSYPPIRAAQEQRLAEPTALPWGVEGPDRAPGRFETAACHVLWVEHLAPLMRSTLKDFMMLGLSVWQHPIRVNEDTLRHEITEVERWPIAAVAYMPFGWQEDTRPGYYALTREGERIRLPKAGTTDGHWTVIGEGDQPHLDGAITALDVCFTKGQLARRAEANLISTIGRTSPVGELPEGIAPDSPEGKLFLAMLRDIGSKIAAGVHSKGGKVYPLEITTQTGTLFTQILEGEARMVAWALMAVDATLGRGENVYNDPGLQAVPQHLKRRDVGVIERAVNNLFAALAMLNQGSAAKSPRLCGHLPDADQEKRRKVLDDETKAAGERFLAYHAAVYAERGNGFVMTQERIDELAKFYRVKAPQLPAAGLPPPLERLPPKEVPPTGGGDAEPVPLPGQAA